jgi:D-beta-D-heptose 7-phosphate kinase/D-beta-D-heptose 1-phosphate adenosyltransferase
MMTRAQTEALVCRFASRRVLVVGDLMVDEYIHGRVSRLSPEAPVPILDADVHAFVPGGAANVVSQIRALGAEAVVAGVAGRDVAGERLIAELNALEADTSAVITSQDRPTTQKTRIVAGGQQIVRVDHEKRAPLPAEIAGVLADRARELLPVCDAVLFSDYDKGVLGRATVRALIEAARDLPVTANPKPASARFYAGADIVQFNRVEADQALGADVRSFEDEGEEGFHQAGARLCALLGVRGLLVTRGALGLTLFRAPNEENGRYTDVAAHRVEVFDGTGAGDSTISGLTLALAAGADLDAAAAIGNAVGGAVVRKAGVATAAPDEVLALFGAG